MQGPRGFKKLGRHTGIYRTHSRMQRVYQGLKMRHSVVSGCHIAGIDLVGPQPSSQGGEMLRELTEVCAGDIKQLDIGRVLFRALPSVVAYKTTDEGVKVRVGKEALEVPGARNPISHPLA
eukprot:1395046-Amorphochlora_amoeboformis.AAC.1